MKYFLLFSVFAGTILWGTADINAQIPRLPSVRPAATPSPSPSPAGQRTESPSPAAATVTANTGGDEYPKHFFFTTEAKATDKVLKAKDLVACIFGDNANPSNKNAFKKVVPTVGGQKGRVIDVGTCDVVVLVVRNAEVEKNLQRDNAGFAVYKIVGDDLELLFKPEAGQHVAVGTMELASSETISKIDLRGCGPSELRNSYRPNPSTWKNWANHFIDEARMATLTPEASPLGRSCDVWIMTPEIHRAFVKRFGAKHPVFDVSPSDPVLRRRK
ncbi:MAG: hypothetical protein IPM50_12395 [Acidobacteriota bacterium]|nr:MAG: hypothetical protein IPM50_12395 [Acidobacteriota bacterium]